MSETYDKHRAYRFADFVLDVDRAALLRDNEEVRLRPKSFDVLRYLVEHRGRVVSRDELLDAVWHGSVVTEDAVTQCLIDIRRALGDTSQELIRTVTRRGYIFELPVTEVREAPPGGASHSRRTRLIIAGVAGVILIGGLVSAALWPTAPDESAADDEPRISESNSPEVAIAVLPFAVMSDNREETYFADGVSEEILNLLARQSGLRVIARTSSFSFRGRDVDIATIAEQLGVSHVLEGSLRRDHDEIRIDVKLVDTATGEYLWSERFDRELSANSLFAMQSEIAETVSESLKAELSVQDRQRLAAMPSRNLDALEAYFEGRARMETRDPQQLVDATRQFEKAIELDPEFALAYVALSDVFRLRSNYGSMSNVEADERSEAAVRSALDINDQLGEAYASQANVLRRRGQFEAAEAAFVRGIELRPNYAPLHQWYAEMLAHALGRTEEAIRYSRIAVALDPRSAIIRRDYAMTLTAAGRFDDAAEQFDVAIDIDSGLALGYSGKAYMLHHFRGNLANAVPLYERAFTIDRASPGTVNALSLALIDLGYFDRASKLLARSVVDSPEHSWSREVLAYVQTLRGDDARAVENIAFHLERVPGAPMSVTVLRDHYLRRGEPEKALQLYRRFEGPLFNESSEDFDLSGWTFPNAIGLSLVLTRLGRVDFANALLDACLEHALRRERDRIGAPDISAARIHSILGETDAALAALRRAVDRGWRTGWHYAYYHDLALENIRGTEEFENIFSEVRADIQRQRIALQSGISDTAISAN